MRTRLNPPDVRIIHAIPFGKGCFRLIAGTDSGNIIVRQPTIPMLYSLISSILSRRVSVVFSFSTNAQMGRVDARRVVASVHNDHACWDRANVKLIRVTMSANRFFSRHQKNAISVSVARSAPFPATAYFFKTIFKYISRADLRVFMQSIGLTNTHITSPAQFPSNGFFCSALDAFKLGFGFIAHRNPPVAISL